MRQSLQSVSDALTKGKTIVYHLIGLPLPPVLIKLQNFTVLLPWHLEKSAAVISLSLQDSYSLYLCLLTSQRKPL